MTLRFDTTTWRTTHASKIRWGGPGIEVVDLELTSGPGKRLYANGLLPTEGQANFDFQVREFAVENVAELLQSDLPVTGRISLDAHVEGPSTDPRMNGRLDFTRGTYNQTSVPDVRGTFAYADQRLTTNATATDSTGRRLAVVDGMLPIDLALSGVEGSRVLDAPIDVKIVSDSLPLALIPNFTTVVTEAGGTARANVTVAGTLKKPDLRGGLTLDRAHFRLGATGARLHDVYGSVRMTGDTVHVDSIAGAANGPVRLTGTLAVGNWREPSFDLTFHAEDAELLNNETGELHANADLKITGPFTRANVTGRVLVAHGVIYIPQSSGKRLIGAGDPQLFSVVDTSVAAEREIFPAQSPLFEGLVVDVALSVDRGTWVRSQEANVEVYTDGPIQVSVQGDALTLTGAVNADRGEYTVLSKRFQITRGSALFIGTPDLNPTVQVTAEYEVKEATNVTNIRVLVGGTVKKPRISLESDAQPPLSQSDLLSYLAFGRSSGSLLQIGSTGTLGGGGLRGGSVVNAASSRLAGVAMGVAVDEFEGEAARSLGMDVFNVTPGELPVSTIETGFSQFIRGTEIEMGRYLSPSTFVSAVTTPGIFACVGGRGENSACSTPGVTLQYRTNKGYRFETSLTPRYILNSPTLAGQTAGSTSQFGAFVIREWRF